MRKNFLALTVLSAFFLTTPSSALDQRVEDAIGTTAKVMDKVAGAVSDVAEGFIDETINAATRAVEEIALLFGVVDRKSLVKAAFDEVEWPVESSQSKALVFSDLEEVVLRDSYGRLPGEANYRLPLEDADLGIFRGVFAQSSTDQNIAFTPIEENIVVDFFGRLPNHPYHGFFGTDKQAEAFLG